MVLPIRVVLRGRKDRRMNEKMTKRKDWIKNAAIVFLIVLLLLTFFSNTIMNYSLPQVATEYVNSGSITTKIRGTGMVESVDPYSVILGDKDAPAVARKISKLLVTVGDTVEKGDVLLYLDEKTNSAIDELEKAVEDAKAAYDAALLSGSINQSVLDQANSSFNAENYSKQIIAAQNEVDEQQKVVDSLTETIAAFELQINISTNSDTAVIAANTAINKADRALELANQEKAPLESAQASLNAKVNQCQNVYTAAVQAYDALVAGGSATPDELTAAEQAKNDAQAALTTATEAANVNQAALNTANTNVANAQSAKAKAETDLTIALIDQKNILNNLNTQLAHYRGQMNAANNLLGEKQDALTKLTGNKDAIISLKTAKDALNKAKKALAEAKEEDISTEVVAEVSGTVTSIAFKSGQTVSTGEELMVIQPAGQGYTVSIPVTTEQAKRVHIGDSAEIVNNWWYSEINAILKSIRPDKNNPATQKLLVFSVEGDVSEGQNLTLSIGDRSSNYELIVPNSAVREDNNGHFVLKVETKSSPLGNRYKATRVDVEVLAQDDTRTAIRGALYNYEYVITTSTQPITAGQLIRLAEN